MYNLHDFTGKKIKRLRLIMPEGTVWIFLRPPRTPESASELVSQILKQKPISPKELFEESGEKASTAGIKLTITTHTPSEIGTLTVSL